MQQDFWKIRWNSEISKTGKINNDTTVSEMKQVLTLDEENDYKKYTELLSFINSSLLGEKNDNLYFPEFERLKSFVSQIKKFWHNTEKIEWRLPLIWQNVIKRSIANLKELEELTISEYYPFLNNIFKKVEKNIDDFKTWNDRQDIEFKKYIDDTKQWLNLIMPDVINNTVYHSINNINTYLNKIDSQASYDSKMDSNFLDVVLNDTLKKIYKNERKPKNEEEREKVGKEIEAIDKRLEELHKKYWTKKEEK